MSLQTGTELARTAAPIIDPRTLKIVALFVEGPLLDVVEPVLHTSDIREVSDIGYIVDDSSVLMPTDGLVRLEEIIDFKFELINLPVVDRHGRNLGKVADYAYDPLSYIIMQLFTHQSLLRSLSTASNVIHRQQIVSVTNEKIVVESATIKDKIVENAEAARGALVNPFRGSQAEPTDHP